MPSTNRKIATMVIGLAGMVATGGTVAWTSAMLEQTPASVAHHGDDMHWGQPPGGGLPNDTADDDTTSPPRDPEDMHW